MGNPWRPSIADIGEFALIDRVRAGISQVGSETVIQGIGDDCAVLQGSNGSLLLLSTDLLRERIHFRLTWTSAWQLGWKSVAVNLSDLAAMGATPRWATFALSLPEQLPVDRVESFYEGAGELASRHGLAIVGGDMTKSPGDLTIAVTVVGECPPGQVLYRNGGQPGDLLLVTGTLGDSAAGLRLLADETAAPLRSHYPHQLAAHLTPTPRVEAGRLAAKSGHVHAAIDLSDGLAGDLNHLCEQSGGGALVELDRLPLTDQCRELANQLGVEAIEWALRGGEDYELLLAVAPDGIDAVQAQLEEAGLPATVVGTLREQGFGIRGQRSDGTCEVLSGAYDHFRR